MTDQTGKAPQQMGLAQELTQDPWKAHMHTLIQQLLGGAHLLCVAEAAGKLSEIQYSPTP